MYGRLGLGGRRGLGLKCIYGEHVFKDGPSRRRRIATLLRELSIGRLGFKDENSTNAHVFPT